MRSLRPVDLARAADISTQQVRRYEALGVIPPASRTPAGYRVYTEAHLDALLTIRAVVRGFGWQRATRALQHLSRGEPERAFALADRVHLDLHEARRRILTTIATLGDADIGAGPRPRAPIGIGAVAAIAGVEVSALRHWEREGLLAPTRDATNRYRLYSPAQVAQARLIASLRAGGYALPLVADVVRELASGNVAAAVRAAERRLAEVNEASIRCAGATAALWTSYNRAPSEAGSTQ